MNIDFEKYHGTGNDFVIIDDRENKIKLEAKQIQAICHRRFGIGADGLMLLSSKEGYDFEMIYFNSDGQPSSMCGNGGRCLSHFAYRRNVFTSKASFLAVDGRHDVKIDRETELVSLAMQNTPAPSVSDSAYHINTGSPHYIQFLENNPFELEEFTTLAKAIRYSDEHRAEGVNVNFVQETGDNSIKMRTYERGVEAETYSCGTGAVAAAISFCQKNDLKNNQEIFIETKGGNLKVKTTAGKQYQNNWLIGPATSVYKGQFNLKDLLL